MLETIVLTVFLIVMIILSVINQKTQKYPNKVLLPLALMTLVWKIYVSITTGTLMVLLNAFGGLVIALLAALFIFGGRKGAIGAGDTKLMMCIGLMLGVIHTIIYLVPAFIFMILLRQSVSLSAILEKRRIATGFIWSLAFLLVFITKLL